VRHSGLLLPSAIFCFMFLEPRRRKLLQSTGENVVQVLRILEAYLSMLKQSLSPAPKQHALQATDGARCWQVRLYHCPSKQYTVNSSRGRIMCLSLPQLLQPSLCLAVGCEDGTTVVFDVITRGEACTFPPSSTECAPRGSSTHLLRTVTEN
jgi:hypothetical protein